VLRAQLRGRRLQLRDEERRCLAVLGHQLGRAYRGPLAFSARLRSLHELGGTLRGLVIHYMAVRLELQTRRTAVRLAMAPGQWLSASGDAGVREQVHGALAIIRPDSRSAVDLARWGEPAARTSGCPRGPDSRPHTEQPWLYRTVRLVDAAEGPQPRRVASAVQTPGGMLAGVLIDRVLPRPFKLLLAGAGLSLGMLAFFALSTAVLWSSPLSAPHAPTSPSLSSGHPDRSSH
jgi:hypothetical protein